MTFDTKQIPAPRGIPLANGKAIHVFLIGCVDYDYPSSAKPHQSGFIYELFGKLPIHEIRTLMSIPVDQFEFKPNAFGGKYAY